MKRALLAASLAALGTVATAHPGYLTHPEVGVIKSPYGLCWRSGSWMPEDAVAPCDSAAQAVAPVEQPAPAPVSHVTEPEPKLALTPVTAQPLPLTPAAVPVVVQPAVAEKVTLSADLLFAFNSATLRDAGKKRLDQLAARLRDTDVNEIKIVGHADRIGSSAYNQRLSEARAAAVGDYLQKTASVRNIRAAGLGKSQPLTGDTCKRMTTKSELIDCLQPDRRVDIDIFGTRAATAQPATAGSGSSAVRVKAD